jgi:hypothetical protein
MAMGGLRSVRDLVANPDNPRSLSARARAKRWAEFTRRFPDLGRFRVLDLGGTPVYWRGAPVPPAHVTTVNLDPELRDSASEDWIRVVIGDACDPGLGDERFDLVVSNSLLEHLGGHAGRSRFAEVVRRHSDRHWVQTPYRYFPLEPHWLFPGFQFLPRAAKLAVTKTWPLGHRHTRDAERAAALVDEVELVSAGAMRGYFPDSQIWYERAAGLPKSIIAIRA